MMRNGEDVVGNMRKRLLPLRVIGPAGLVMLVALAFAAGSVGASSAVDARVLLSRMMSAEETVHASFSQTEARVLAKRLETTTERVYLDSGRKRSERYESKYAKTVVTVTDGENTWTYVTGLPFVLREPARQGTLRAGKSTGLLIAGLGTVEFGGRTADLVETTNKLGVKTRFWIDGDTFLLLKEERYDEQGRTIYSMNRTNLDFSPPDAPGRFSFTPGRDVKVLTEKHAWKRAVFAHIAADRVPFPVLVPGFVPVGFAFETGDIIEVQESPVVVSRFRKGNLLLLLFQREAASVQERAVGGRKKVLTRPQGDVAIFEQRQGGFVLTLIGPISEKDARQVLASLAPFKDDQ